MGARPFGRLSGRPRLLAAPRREAWCSSCTACPSTLSAMHPLPRRSARRDTSSARTTMWVMGAPPPLLATSATFRSQTAWTSCLPMSTPCVAASSGACMRRAFLPAFRTSSLATRSGALLFACTSPSTPRASRRPSSVNGPAAAGARPGGQRALPCACAPAGRAFQKPPYPRARGGCIWPSDQGRAYTV